MPKKKTSPRLGASNAPRPTLRPLAAWLDEGLSSLAQSEKEMAAKGVPFMFRFGREVLLVKDNMIGNLKQWAQARGLSYAQVVLRKRAGKSIDEMLDPFHGHLIEHSAWSLNQRRRCGCVPCKQFVWLRDRVDNTHWVACAPKRVCEPDRWYVRGARERGFEYKGKIQSLRQWSEELNLSYSHLHSTLLIQGCSIDRIARGDPAPLVHGLRGTYQYHRCRCEACCEASARYYRELSRRSKKS